MFPAVDAQGREDEQQHGALFVTYFANTKGSCNRVR